MNRMSQLEVRMADFCNRFSVPWYIKFLFPMFSEELEFYMKDLKEVLIKNEIIKKNDFYI